MLRGALRNAPPTGQLEVLLSGLASSGSALRGELCQCRASHGIANASLVPTSGSQQLEANARAGLRGASAEAARQQRQPDLGSAVGTAQGVRRRQYSQTCLRWDLEAELHAAVEEEIERRLGTMGLSQQAPQWQDPQRHHQTQPPHSSSSSSSQPSESMAAAAAAAPAADLELAAHLVLQQQQQQQQQPLSTGHSLQPVEPFEQWEQQQPAGSLPEPAATKRGNNIGSNSTSSSGKRGSRRGREASKSQREYSGVEALPLQPGLQPSLQAKPAQPPWLELTREQRRDALERFRRQQHHSVASGSLAALHPSSSLSALPFLGVEYVLPATASCVALPQMVSMEFERIMKLAEDARHGRTRQRSGGAFQSAEATAAAAEVSRACAAQAQAEAEAAQAAADAAVRAALARVEAAANKLRRLRSRPLSTRVAAAVAAAAAAAAAEDGNGGLGAGVGAGAAVGEGGVAVGQGAVSRGQQLEGQHRHPEIAVAAAQAAVQVAPAPDMQAGVAAGAEGMALQASAAPKRRRACKKKPKPDPPSSFLLPALEPLFPSPSLQSALKSALAKLDKTLLTGRTGRVFSNSLPAPLRKEGAWQGLSPERAVAIVEFLLEEAGAAPADVIKAVASSPWLLGLSVEEHARPNLEILRQHGLSSKQPRPEAGAAGIAGAAGGASARVAAPLSGREAYLRSVLAAGGSSQAGRVVTRSPLLLAVPGEAHLQPLLQYLCNLGVPIEGLERILKQDRSLLGEGGLQRLRTSVAFFCGKLLGQDEIARIACRVPKVLGFSPTCLGLKWFYLEEALGGGAHDIVKVPQFLTCSLESIGGRVTLAESLGVPILLPSKPPGLGTVTLSMAAAAKKGRSQLDGVTLTLLVLDTDKKFATRLGVPLEQLQQSIQQFRAGDWRTVLESLGK